MNIVLIIKENPLLGPVYRGVTSAVEIVPYYLFREYLYEECDLNLNPRLDRIEVGFLDSSDLKAISKSPEVPDSEETLLRRLDNGCMCLGIKHEDQIAAYTWCNLEKCDYDGRLVFRLEEDEAYLFDARTFQAYRGKNLAPYLRYQLYEHLAKMGRTRFYSATSLLNASALRFKEKLRARRVRLYVYFGLFKRFTCNILLRQYMNGEDPSVKS